MRGAAFALSFLLAAPLGCGSRERANIGAPDTPGDDTEAGVGGASEGAGTAIDAGSDAAVEEQPAASAPPPVVDPKTAELALERASQPTAIEQAPYGLRFEILEQGPELPWAFVILNQGAEPVEVAVDPRLLRFELEVPPPPPDPAKKKPAKVAKPKLVKCELPEGIRPAKVDKRLSIELHPDEYVVETFDPRLYCLPTGGKSLLDAQVKVTPRLGWPVKTKAVWRKGKREEEVLPQVAPFIATPASKAAEPEAAAPEPSPQNKKGAASASAEKKEDPGVKELVGTTITLGDDYAVRPSPPPPGPLDLVLSRGSDASSEETATITVRVKNISKDRQQVFFRRELMSFVVSGPDGMVSCDPQPDSRVPDKQAFRTLAPGGFIEATSRLIELCPDDTFARPGLYLARARFSPHVSGEDFGIEAVTGDFTSAQPAIIRIRSGELPFRKNRPLIRSKVAPESKSAPEPKSAPESKAAPE
jgi:hypothetical protein